MIKPQTCISPDMKSNSQIKPRLRQGRTGIKRKTLKFSMSQLHDKPEQLKLLPGRSPSCK